MALKLKTALTIFLGLFLISLAVYTNKFFGVVSLDQVFSTLTFGFHGVIAADSVFIKRFVVWCLLWPIVITIPLSLINFRYVGLVLILAGLTYDCYQFKLIDYCKHLYKPKIDFFETHYIDPKAILFKADKPKSLVLIYVESLEATYSDKDAFGYDLLRSLKHLKGNTLSFERFIQMPGTGWTMAGLISTQCGIPLKSLTIFGGNRIGENVSSFLPGAKCLSDILAEQGYTNVFLNGSSLRFGGKGQFIRNHHYTAYGKEEWLAQGVKASEMVGWGLTDDLLFKQARIKLNELIKADKPFNLTILTVDMHGVDGQLNQHCQKQGYRNFEGIVECSANEVSDFIHYIQDHDWLKQLNIVVLGDHLAMQNLVYDKLLNAKSRTIFNLFITDKPLTKNTDEIIHFDMLPTILESLGYSANQLALGHSAIGDHTVTSSNRITEITSNIEYDSNVYNRLWIEA